MSVYTQRDVHPFGHRAGGCMFQLEGHAVTAGRLGAADEQGSFWRTARITMDASAPCTGIRSTHPVVSLFRPIQHLPWHPKIKQGSDEGHVHGCFRAALFKIYLLYSPGSNCPRISKGQDWNEVLIKMVGFCLTLLLKCLLQQSSPVHESLCLHTLVTRSSVLPVCPRLPPKSQKCPKVFP